MAKISVPVTMGFDQQKVIGVLNIESGHLPMGTDFVFSPAYNFRAPDAVNQLYKYDLVGVGLVHTPAKAQEPAKPDPFTEEDYEFLIGLTVILVENGAERKSTDHVMNLAAKMAQVTDNKRMQRIIEQLKVVHRHPAFRTAVGMLCKPGDPT